MAKQNFRQKRIVALSLGLVLAAIGCSTTPDLPEPGETPDDLSPDQGFQSSLKKAGFPHPAGDEFFQLRVTFFGKKTAPAPDTLSKCDFDYQTERALARTTEDLFQTFPAHVTGNPSLYHWCFYFKLMELQEEADRFEYMDQKQKFILERYEFIAYLARVFEADQNDSRYLENARAVYRKLSRSYFGGR